MSGLTGPRTAVRGNLIAATGMAIAIVATLLTPHVWDGSSTPWLIVLALLLGTAIGLPAARRVHMTAMPQMVALFNGVGGGAVAIIAWVEYRHHFGGRLTLKVGDPVAVRGDRRLDLVLGLEYRVRQAPGDPPEPPDQAARAGDHQRRAVRDRGRQRDHPRLRDALPGAVHPWDPGDGGAAREHGGAADRRRRHAGRDLAAERVHRTVGGGDRNRAEQHRADRRRA